jgi:hypothetical protein
VVVGTSRRMTGLPLLLPPTPPAPQFLCDDKGSVTIAVFGLGGGCSVTATAAATTGSPASGTVDAPPVATAAVLAALVACASLWERGLLASVGAASGPVFAGPLGGASRREFAVLGDTVNTAARLMQRAATVGGGVICDDATAAGAAGCGLAFVPLDAVVVKGRATAVRVCRPYPPALAATLPQRDKPGTQPSAFAAVAAAQAGAVAAWGVLRPVPPPLRALRLAAAAAATRAPSSHDESPCSMPGASSSSTASAAEGASGGSSSTVRYRRRPSAALSSGSSGDGGGGSTTAGGEGGVHHRRQPTLHTPPPPASAAVSASPVPLTFEAVFSAASAAAAPAGGAGCGHSGAPAAVAAAGGLDTAATGATTAAASPPQHTRLTTRAARARKGSADADDGGSSNGARTKGAAAASAVAADPFAPPPPPPSGTFVLSSRVTVPPSTHNAALRGITPVYALDVCVADSGEGNGSGGNATALKRRFLLPVPEAGDGGSAEGRTDADRVLSQLVAAVGVDAVPLLHSSERGDGRLAPAPPPPADLVLLRDTAVDAAVTRGLLPLPAAAAPQSYRLRVRGTSVLLPADSGVPAAWLWEVARACRAVNAESMAHDGVLRVELTTAAVDGQRLPQVVIDADPAVVTTVSEVASSAAVGAAADGGSGGAPLPAVTTVSHGGAFTTLLGCKLRLAATGAPAVVTLSGATGGGTTAVLQRFAHEALPGAMSFFALAVPALPLQAHQSGGGSAGGDAAATTCANVWCDWGARYLGALAGELRLGDATSAAERVLAAWRSSTRGIDGGADAAAAAAAAAVDPSLWNRCFGTRLVDEGQHTGGSSGTAGGAGADPTATAAVAGAVLVLLGSACSVRPATLVIDGAHRMSEAEAAVTRVVVAALGCSGPGTPRQQHLPPLKLLLVLAGSGDAPHAVLRSTPAGGGGGRMELHRLSLASLSRGQSDTLVAACLRWGGGLCPSLRAYVWAVARGNPGATLAVTTALLADGWLAWASCGDGGGGAGMPAGSLSAAAAAAVPWGVRAAGVPLEAGAAGVPPRFLTAAAAAAAAPLLPTALATLRAAAHPRPGALSLLDRLLLSSAGSSSATAAGGGGGRGGNVAPAHAALQRGGGQGGGGGTGGGGHLTSTLQRLSSIARFGGRPTAVAHAMTPATSDLSRSSSSTSAVALPVNPLYLHTYAARGSSGGGGGGGKRHAHIADVLAAAGVCPPQRATPRVQPAATAAAVPAAAASAPAPAAAAPTMLPIATASRCCPCDLPFGPLAVLDAAAAAAKHRRPPPPLLGAPSRVLLLRPPSLPAAWASPSLPLPPSLCLSAAVRGIDAAFDGLPAAHRLTLKALSLCDGALRQPAVALQQLSDAGGTDGGDGSDDAAARAVAPVAVPFELLLRAMRAATGTGDGAGLAAAEDGDGGFTAGDLAQLLAELAAEGNVCLRTCTHAAATVALTPPAPTPPPPTHVAFTSPLGAFAAGRRVLPEQARPVLRALAAAPEVAAARALAAAAAAAAQRRRATLLLATTSAASRRQPRHVAALTPTGAFHVRDLPLPPPALGP